MRKWITWRNFVPLTIWTFVLFSFIRAIVEGEVIRFLIGSLLFIAVYIGAFYAFNWIRSIVAVRSWVKKYPNLVYIGLMQIEFDTTGQYGSKLRKRVLKYAMTQKGRNNA